ncbi:MAG: glycosyltransferase family 1 protein [Rhodocyclaceae bacterium]|nr:MAG: glycosyltransferase family 1 protein [Rhodocyclaceae bacterium]
MQAIHDVAGRPVTRPLRIALVTETYPPEINGVAMTLGRMVDGLLRRGHSLQLVRPRQSADESAVELRPGGGGDEVLVRGLPIPGYSGLKFGLPAKGRLVKLWWETRPDLVHVVTEGPLGWSAIAAARKLKLPVTSDFHTNFHSYCRHYGFAWLQSPMSAYLRMLHNRSDATLVPTHTLARELEGEGYQNLAVVSRGVDVELFNPRRRSAELRSSWGVQPDSLVVIYAGRLAPEKNLPVVLDAFAAIRVTRPDAKLLFVGDGPMRVSLQASCPDAVFAGMRTGCDLAAHYASADLFLFASLTETFGNVTSEALASGLAVLAYDCAAAADLIIDGSNGRTVPPADAAAFVSAAMALACDRMKLQQMRSRSARSVAHLNWELIHDSFEQTLGDVVGMHQRPGCGQRELAVVPD